LLSTTSFGHRGREERKGPEPSIAWSSGLSLGDHHDVHVGGPDVIDNGDPCAGQSGRDRAPTHPVSPANRNAKRVVNNVDKRCYPRITCPLSELPQLVRENLMALPGSRFAHAYALVIPHTGF
jgi:hypothetical protein